MEIKEKTRERLRRRKEGRRRKERRRRGGEGVQFMSSGNLERVTGHGVEDVEKSFVAEEIHLVIGGG